MTLSAETIATQLLFAHLATPKRKVLRHKQLRSGGYGLLRAAGLGKNQASAVSEILARHGAKWRDENHEPTSADLQAVLEPLLV